jgi:N-acetylmuramoyl-L-alanine amidase
MSSAAARPAALRRAATGTGATLALAAVTVTATAGAAHAETRYTVKPGDTASHIAARTGTTVSAIAQANALSDPGRIVVGQVLTIPSSTPAPAAAPVVAAPAPAAVPATYTVRTGDTVTRIASRTGASVAAIVQANALDGRAFIRAGQVLTIPGVAAAAAPASAPAVAAAPAPTTSYTVVAGDTLTRIAATHSTTIAAIASLSGIKPSAVLRIGQTVTLPAPPAPALVGDTFAGRTYPPAVVAAANANLAALRAKKLPGKAQVQATVVATARKLGVSTSLAQAVAYQESGFNAAVVSPANAIGVMQVIPSSGAWASTIVGRHLDLLDPSDNIVAGVVILRALVAGSPDLPTAIAGYYQGLSSVQANGQYADTRRYVAAVQTLMTRFP